jgi:hypothetical protein
LERADLEEFPKSWKDQSMLNVRFLAVRAAVLSTLVFAALPAAVLSPRGWKWG